MYDLHETENPTVIFLLDSMCDEIISARDSRLWNCLLTPPLNVPVNVTLYILNLHVITEQAWSTLLRPTCTATVHLQLSHSSLFSVSV